MKRKPPIDQQALQPIVAVKALSGLRLKVTRQGGVVVNLDMSEWIAGLAFLSPLRDDPALFAAARVGENGASVSWDGERFEIDSLHLWLLEQEQAGVPLFSEALKRWRSRNALTLDAAAKAIGVSRRMLSYYESGQGLAPKHIGLACKGYETLMRQQKPKRPAAA